MEGAHDKLQQRKNDGHKLYVVTARNECLLSPTIQRVETHFANLIEDIYFANHDNEHSIPKSGICKQIGATFMIEDHLDYALELTENNIKAYLLAKPRNHHFDPTVHD
ncbi:MAG: hypothetical protein Q8O99_01145 [bacterium]|nr:hypothetical protein [bacterium]